jgi:hypothetical protein
MGKQGVMNLRAGSVLPIKDLVSSGLCRIFLMSKPLAWFMLIEGKGNTLSLGIGKRGKTTRKFYREVLWCCMSINVTSAGTRLKNSFLSVKMSVSSVRDAAMGGLKNYWIISA